MRPPLAAGPHRDRIRRWASRRGRRPLRWLPVLPGPLLAPLHERTMSTGARMVTGMVRRSRASPRWTPLAFAVLVESVASGCGWSTCFEELRIHGDLDIPYEPERTLTVRACHNASCETADGVGASGELALLSTISASASFINLPDRRHVYIQFWGSSHEPDDDYSVDIWLENGDHILNVVLLNAEVGGHCGAVTHEF